MSKDLVFYRDKKEKFKCNLVIDGAQLDKSSVRLCLEMKDGANYFFKGKIDLNGTCIINIPALPNITQEAGIAIVEVIAESSYFNVYEAPFKIKNSVSVKFEPEIEESIEETDKPKISFSLIEEKIEPEIIKQSKKIANTLELPKEILQKHITENIIDNPNMQSIAESLEEFITFNDFIERIK